MWALPNIREMNRGAKSRGAKAQIRRALTRPETVECTECGTHKAVSAQPYFDVFSDDPKGIVAMCERCEQDYGSTPEGYFTCEQCGRLFVENYTWERYEAYIESFGSVCLNCYRDWYLGDDEHWLALDEQTIDGLEIETVRHAPHLLAVGMDTPKNLRQIGDGALFDSYSGEGVNWGLARLKAELQAARKRGATRAVLILDAAYQFCGHIGVYVERPVRQRRSRPVAAAA